jgi:PKHD-type hydroxylase
MFYTFNPDINSTKVLTADPFLTKEECDKIINYATKLENRRTTGKISGSEPTNKMGALDKNVRKSNIIWLDSGNDQDLTWLFDKIAATIYDVNFKEYRFDLLGLAEPIQFTEYTELGDHYSYHVDTVLNGIVRKLSMTIQLSSEDDYTGGEVEIKIDENKNFISKKQGSLTVFPSYLLHKVKPLKSGKRYSLVTWVTGPAFK